MATAKLKLWLKRLALGGFGFLALYFLLIFAHQQYVAHKFLERIADYPKPPLQRILPAHLNTTAVDESEAYAAVTATCQAFTSHPTESTIRDFASPATLIEILRGTRDLVLPLELESALSLCADELDALERASRSKAREPIASYWPFVPSAYATSARDTPNYLRLNYLTKALRIRAAWSNNANQFIDSLAASMRILADQGINGNLLSGAIVNIYSQQPLETYEYLLSVPSIEPLAIDRIVTDLTNIEAHLVDIDQNRLGEYAFTMGLSLRYANLPYVDRGNFDDWMEDASLLDAIYRYTVAIPLWAVVIDQTHENLDKLSDYPAPQRHIEFLKLLRSRQRIFYNLSDQLLEEDGATTTLLFNAQVDFDREIVKSRLNAIRLLATSIQGTKKPTERDLHTSTVNVDPLTGQGYQIASYADGITIESIFDFEKFKKTFPSSRIQSYKVKYHYPK